MRALQPLLHEQVVLVAAPAQILCATDATIGAPRTAAGTATAAPTVEGLFHSDTRLLATRTTAIGCSPLEPLTHTVTGAATATFTTLARQADPDGADPRTVLTTRRDLSSTGTRATLTESLELTHAWAQPLTTTLTILLTSDLAPLDSVKQGHTATSLAWEATGTSASVTDGVTTATVTAPGARLEATTTPGPDGAPVPALALTWDVTTSRTAPFTASWTLDGVATAAVVVRPAPLPQPQRADVTDPRAAAWLATALDDLDHLLLARRQTPHQAFAAAGAPWFLTLFGRDSLWTARLLLQANDPWSLALAEGTLRTLADLQGTHRDIDSACQPGKIMHELRHATNNVEDGTVLPPLYYGTIDATPLWIILLDEAERAGLSHTTIRDLLPALRAALGWLRDEADADGDGFIEYHDESGHGLTNQGWKDSGDSVQFADGSIAQGPIALVEVQAYAHAAALAGARLLRLLDGEAASAEADTWQAWATTLRGRFTDAFWVGDTATGYPAIALDAHKQKVNSLTSNLGHLLGTGILDTAQTARVAELLVSPALSSGYGLRTLASTMGGYWPLSYHGGSVWTHDTAIAIDGLLREGHVQEARTLAEGLLAAAPHFSNRMPELYSGAPASDGVPTPYPASCRPQAWAAAASAVVARAV